MNELSQGYIGRSCSMVEIKTPVEDRESNKIKVPSYKIPDVQKTADNEHLYSA